MPDLLSSISYEELKTLALAYPAAHNLRILLALKAQQADHPEFKKQLAAAAAFSLDRNKLFLMFVPAQLAPQRVAVQEEILELKPIEDIRKELESKIPREKTGYMKEKAKSIALEEPGANPGHAEPSAPNAPQMPPPSSNLLTAAATASELNTPTGARWISLSHLPVLGRVAADPEAEEVSAHPAQSEETAAPPVSIPRADAKIEPEHPDALPQEEGGAISAQELAERSVQLREVVASETFARLLARQGYKEKAVAMYEKLCLLFPEKSAYFAAEILKLKK
ncbi:MAG: hypothetical protein ACR2K1_08545 [Saprospiraceae bacterium]